MWRQSGFGGYRPVVEPSRRATLAELGQRYELADNTNNEQVVALSTKDGHVTTVTMGSTDAVAAVQVANLPSEMFSIIKTSGTIGPRLGCLRLAGRQVLETPHFLAITSRGVVPHITQDSFAGATGISGVYVPLEDCTFRRRPLQAYYADQHVDSVKL